MKQKKLNTSGLNVGRSSYAEPADQTDILRECEAILSSEMFINSPRMSRLFRYLIDKAVSKQERDTQEYIIGINVFDRDALTYHTGDDPTVRVQVGRLRKKLKDYYKHYSSMSELEISIPLGRYTPIIKRLKTSGPSAIDKRCRITIHQIICIASNCDATAFAKGLREELTHHLVKILEKHAVIQSSVFPLDEIRAEKNYQFEGTVRTGSECIRVTVRLVDTVLGHIVWSEQYDQYANCTITCQQKMAVTTGDQLKRFLCFC